MHHWSPVPQFVCLHSNDWILFKIIYIPHYKDYINPLKAYITLMYLIQGLLSYLHTACNCLERELQHGAWRRSLTRPGHQWLAVHGEGSSWRILVARQSHMKGGPVTDILVANGFFIISSLNGPYEIIGNRCPFQHWHDMGSEICPRV